MRNTLDEIKKSLVEQHIVIQDDMEKIAEMINSGWKINADAVYGLLVKLNKDLNEHLQLENQQFYPEIIKQNINDEKIEKLKEFFRNMTIMEKTIDKFLKKYSAGEKIKSSLPDFKKEFDEIKETLDLRINLEETKFFYTS